MNTLSRLVHTLAFSPTAKRCLGAPGQADASAAVGVGRWVAVGFGSGVAAETLAGVVSWSAASSEDKRAGSALSTVRPRASSVAVAANELRAEGRGSPAGRAERMVKNSTAPKMNTPTPAARYQGKPLLCVAPPLSGKGRISSCGPRGCAAGTALETALTAASGSAK